MSRARIAAGSIAGLFGVLALVTPGLVRDEGWVLRTYPDPIQKLTACAGVTRGVTAGRLYTQAECEAMTAQAMLEHAIAIRPCLPDSLPPETHAAFVSFAYNVGAAKFCGSTLSRKARAGDLRGACAELSRWVNAGGRPLAGLVRRRAEERALCERGLP